MVQEGVQLNTSKCPSDLDHAKDAGMEMHGTREAPIPVSDKRVEHYVPSEYAEMGRKLGFHHICHHALLKIDGKTVDRNVAREANGKHHVFYFDVSEPYATSGKQMEDFIAELKRRRLRLNPREKQLLEMIEADEKARQGTPA
jgi:hypothetical protein